MNIFIDPAYKAYYENRLFDADNKVLNRDGTLLPYIRLKAWLESKQYCVQTADFLYDSKDVEITASYFSFGLLDNLDILAKHKNIRLQGFVIFEPPVVAPDLYRQLPKLTRLFDTVYLHNVVGDGYSLQGVATYKLKKFYWPQPHNDVLLPLWKNTARKRRVVVINSHHKPTNNHQELYSQRIAVMAQLAEYDLVDLYGHNWDKWYSRTSLWWPYWSNYSVLRRIYQGSCASKLDVLSQYYFCLCFENSTMLGYVTEKLFDCLYAGTIPIYLGAQDIEEWIPKDVYIDYRQFANIACLTEKLQSMSTREILGYQEAGRDFLQSQSGAYFYSSLHDMFKEVV